MGTGRVEVREVPDPQILNRGDAIVRVTSTAICGSDLHLYHGFGPAMRKGDVLGHEFMGEVVDVGRDVHTLAIGDRVVVPFTIACGRCWHCRHDLWSLCENSNPNAAAQEALLGHAGTGAFGCSRVTGGFAGGQAEYVRVPFADVGPLKVDRSLADDDVLFLSDVLPTGYMGAEMCDLRPGDTVAVWGCGPVGLFAIQSAFLLGAERVIAIDRFLYRLELARRCGAETVNYDDVDSVPEALVDLTAGRGPDACIDAVGLEAHGHGLDYFCDRARHALHAHADRPVALREAITACRSGGVIAVIGAYSGPVHRFPLGTLMNRGLTIRAAPCHVHRYMRPLLARIVEGDFDPAMVITHRLPLADAARGYALFAGKQDNCEKVVLRV
jgi:threonine dehydrogenase-like Zn-dependent dehydrogenase